MPERLFEKLEALYQDTLLFFEEESDGKKLGKPISRKLTAKMIWDYLDQFESSTLSLSADSKKNAFQQLDQKKKERQSKKKPLQMKQNTAPSEYVVYVNFGEGIQKDKLFKTKEKALSYISSKDNEGTYVIKMPDGSYLSNGD